MMILNQVTRAFTSRKRRTTTLFRRPKTASTIIIDNEVRKKQDDYIFSLQKNHTVDDDDDDIVSTTSNSSTTIDLTPCSSARCVITTSSKSMKRTDIDINRIPPVPTLLQSDNDDINDNAEHIILDLIPSLRRSTSITNDHEFDNTMLCSYDDDDDEDEFDSDCDDSCIFAPPPVPFVCVPINFTHADALLQTTQDNNCNIHPNNILLLNRPPTRLGDWDAHTIESNNLEDDELSDTTTHTSNRSAAEAAGTNTSSSMTMHIVAGRRHYQARRRHQARAVLSQKVRQVSSTSIRYSNTNNSKDTRTQQRSISIRNDDGKQQQQQQQYQQQDTEDERQQPQRQPRVVKWNMIR